MINTLERLSRGIIPTEASGICRNVHKVTGVRIGEQAFYKPALRSWKHFSGDYRYPVPGGQDAYGDGCHWEGEQRDYRVSLCEHLLKELTQWTLNRY
jgi:hypothetical protein